MLSKKKIWLTLVLVAGNNKIDLKTNKLMMINR
jgi:hypothetical protein